MKRLPLLSSLVFIIVQSCCAALTFAEDLPPTLLATRGKLIASEDFAKPLAPLEGKPVGFASGFTGWRYTAAPATGHGGSWEVKDGLFHGIENPKANHPATASYGIKFKDAIIQCDVRLEDVPAEGRKYRSFFIKATDEKDYLCALFGSAGAVNALAYDPDSIQPGTHQRGKLPVVSTPVTAKLGQWHTAVLEILGDEMVATVDGKSVTVKAPLIGKDKHSVMLGVGTEASFRNFRMWEALPNPDWAKYKEILPKPKAAKP